MLNKIIVISLVTFLWGCRFGGAPTTELKFDSAHAVGVDATIADGRIISSSEDPYFIEMEIREQLKYTIGVLNGWGGGPDLNRLDISVGEVQVREDGLFDVAYAASLFVAWPRDRQMPSAFTFILPAQGSYQGRREFFETYGGEVATRRGCLDPYAHDVSVDIFWYYYRPESRGCPLNRPQRGEENSVARLRADFALSKQNTSNKYPEYEKVWEDGRLVATAIFGKNEAGATANDPGISAFSETYHRLVNTYGYPVETNLPQGAYPGVDHDDLRLVFNTYHGPLDVHLYLVDSIRSVDMAFRETYNERTKISDFVSYSGHSGLGANIRAMASMGTFEAGQYQLFLINGCDTFAYVDHALRDAHHAVNPEHGPDKFFDIITNAMPSYFHANARSNMAIIDAMVTQQLTYRQILSQFDSAQKAVVDGEGDNAWPTAF